MSLLAAQHPISSAERVPKIWYFAWNLGLVFSRNNTVWNGKCFGDAIRSSSTHPYRGNEGFKTLKHQWMSHLTAQHFISSAERVPKIWYFLAWNLRLVFRRNDTVWSIKRLQMLPKGFSILLMYLNRLMIHSITNGCLSLQLSILFPVLRGCAKSDILHEIQD